MTHILHQIDHAIELLDDAYPSVDRSIRETLERAHAEITSLRAVIADHVLGSAVAKIEGNAITDDAAKAAAITLPEAPK